MSTTSFAVSNVAIQCEHNKQRPIHQTKPIKLINTNQTKNKHKSKSNITPAIDHWPPIKSVLILAEIGVQMNNVFSKCIKHTVHLLLFWDKLMRLIHWVFKELKLFFFNQMTWVFLVYFVYYTFLSLHTINSAYNIHIYIIEKCNIPNIWNNLFHLLHSAVEHLVSFCLDQICKLNNLKPIC